MQQFMPPNIEDYLLTFQQKGTMGIFQVQTDQNLQSCKPYRCKASYKNLTLEVCKIIYRKPIRILS